MVTLLSPLLQPNELAKEERRGGVGESEQLGGED
jgi:hypothetical protein